MRYNKFFQILKYLKNPIFMIMKPYLINYLYNNILNSKIDIKNQNNNTHIDNQITNKEQYATAQIGILMSRHCTIQEITQDIQNARNFSKNQNLIFIMLTICILFLILSILLLGILHNNKFIQLICFCLFSFTLSAISNIYTYVFGFRQSMELTIFLINILIYETLCNKKN